MANPLPTQPVTQGPPASPPPGKAPGIVQAFVGVLTKPAEFYASVRDVGGFGGPVIFALVLGLVAGVINAVFMVVGFGAVGGAAGGAIGIAAAFGTLVMTPIFAVIGCFIGGAIVHVVSLVAGGKGTYEQSVRVAGYAAAIMPISAVLGFVPVLRWLPGLYGLYLAAQGLIAIHAADRKKTYVVTGVLAGILVLFAVMGMLAGRAVEDKFGPNSEFQREMQKAQREMQRASEELQRQQQQQPQK